MSGCGRTNTLLLHSKSPGRMLYSGVKGISPNRHILIHGVNVIKHRTPLRDQGIHDMSTVFIFQTMGKGGGGNGTSIKQATGWYQKYNCEMCQCNSFGIHMHAYAHL